MEVIPFNRPYMTGKELYYIARAHFNGALAGDGPFTKKCHELIKRKTKCSNVLLTHSCTAALEMCALLLNIQEGDEVIIPSYTFVSTANAFVLRGAIPVFVDIRSDTLNLNENLIESAITENTRAIVPVHYAGVSCEMYQIVKIAAYYNIKVVEDAAQGMMSSYHGVSLGTLGHLGTFSFHETKNVTCGEGGCILVNDFEYLQKAEIIREKGTDRTRFFNREVDKYTWQEIGSSFLPGELSAAFLTAQLEEIDKITSLRLASWNIYHNLLSHLEEEGLIRRPIIPEHCEHNAHMYYIILNEKFNKSKILQKLADKNIHAVSHYEPLHLSPAGKKYGRVHGDLSITESIAKRLIRLPLWIGITFEQQERVVSTIEKLLRV